MHVLLVLLIAQGPALDLETAPPPPPIARSLTLASGVLALAAGTAFGIWGATRRAEATTTICVFPSEQPCGSDWMRFPSSDPREEAKGGLGPAMVPLGYSLLISGTIWTFGPKLFETEGDVPWLSIAIGLAAGALSYGLSETASNRGG